jgi:hypothetical protein
MTKQKETTCIETPYAVFETAKTADPDFLNRLISEQSAAAFLGLQVKTLQGWRVRGGGPAFVRLSRRAVRYQRRCLLNWVEARVHTSTSEYVL